MLKQQAHIMETRTGTPDSPKLSLAAERKEGVWFYWAKCLELTKPRLSMLSVVTVLIGYYAARPAVDYLTLFHLAAGTSLAAGGAAALNQWLERETDTAMARTRNRPIPAKYITPVNALILGLALCIVGTTQLFIGIGMAAGVLVATTIALYVAVYTPLKKRTRWCTEIGAIPGAIPPLIGWVAAGGGLSIEAWALFGILFFWQMPHFHAIAWMYRKDYAAAGFPMLSAIDADGKRVAHSMGVYGVLLLAASVVPVFSGAAGAGYLFAALILGGYFLAQIFKFGASTDPDAAARKVFFVSIIYLPLVLGCLVADIWFMGRF